MLTAPINLMIVDDSKIIRKILRDIVITDQNIKVIAEAENGKDAIEKLISTKIDVILLDIDMPIMNGIDSIPKILAINKDIKILMVSNHTLENAPKTIRALSAGAADYIAKPAASSKFMNCKEFAKQLIYKISILANTKNNTNDRIVVDIKLNNSVQEKYTKFESNKEVIAIASSTGGPKSLTELFSKLDKNFLADKIIFINQHMPESFIVHFVNSLNNIGTGFFKIAEKGEEVKKGLIYVAPANYHTIVKKDNNKIIIDLLDDQPVNCCRPSADVMVESIFQIYKKLTFIVLTGMGQDGLNAAKKISSSNCRIIAQDKNSSVVWGMPGCVAKEGICHAVLPIHEIANYLKND